jgi:glutathione S-transferase
MRDAILYHLIPDIQRQIAMLLFYSNTSPYSRKARLVVAEKGLAHSVEERACNPFEEVAELRALNPLGKVPTLVTDQGQAIYDSPVICEYLDGIRGDPLLVPPSGPGRWSVRCWEALADGILDAAYCIVMERRRPAGQQSEHWLAHWTAEIERAIRHADSEMEKLPDSLSLAHLALAAALGYLDFRLPDTEWRKGLPALSHWFGEFDLRPSMQRTRPD